LARRAFVGEVAQREVAAIERARDPVGDAPVARVDRARRSRERIVRRVALARSPGTAIARDALGERRRDGGRVGEVREQPFLVPTKLPGRRGDPRGRGAEQAHAIPGERGGEQQEKPPGGERDRARRAHVKLTRGAAAASGGALKNSFGSKRCMFATTFDGAD